MVSGFHAAATVPSDGAGRSVMQNRCFGWQHEVEWANLRPGASRGRVFSWFEDGLLIAAVGSQLSRNADVQNTVNLSLQKTHVQLSQKRWWVTGGAGGYTQVKHTKFVASSGKGRDGRTMRASVTSKPHAIA